MPDHEADQTPFDEFVNEQDTPAAPPPAPRAEFPPPSTACPRPGRWNIVKFLKSVKWPPPERLPTGTLVGLSMTAGALLVFILSTLMHAVLPRPQSRFNTPLPIARKPRPAAPVVVEITPSTTATMPPAVDAMHSASPNAAGAADVIKDPQAFEFDQKLAEQRRLENEKLTETRKLEDQKLLEARKLEDQKLLEQQRLDEDQRIAAERKLADDKLAAERKLEDERVTAARQQAEARKLEADQKLADARKLDDQRRADQRKLEDDKMSQQRRNEDQQRQPTSKL